MSDSHSPTIFAPTEYDVIEATMGDSARGRWFLAEHARRNRGADTDILLGAMARLENAVTAGRGLDGLGHLRGDMTEMAHAISRTRAEIAAIGAADPEQSRLSIASEALDGIVRATEYATTDILAAAEAVQETAWLLRERGVEAAACDDLDRYATQVYTACSFQDLTAQRTGRIVQTLRYLEERLLAMMSIWGEADAGIPGPPGEHAKEAQPVDLCQSDVDRYIDMDAPRAATAALRSIGPGAIPLHDDIVFLPARPEPEPAIQDIEPDWDEPFEADVTAAAPADEPAEPGTAAPGAPHIEAKAAIGAIGLGVIPLHDDIVFLPARPEPEPAIQDIEGGWDEAFEADLAAAAPADEPAEPEAEAGDDEDGPLMPPAERSWSFAEIDALSVEEKFALFC